MKKLFNELRHMNNQKGYTLIIVVLAITVISILGLSILTYSSSSLKRSVNERNDQSAYYIAESGLTKTKIDLTAKINKAYANSIEKYKQLISSNKNNNQTVSFANIFKQELDLIDIESLKQPVTDFDKQFSNSPIAKPDIKVDFLNNQLIYTISSTGFIDRSKVNSTSGNSGIRKVSQKIVVKLDNSSSNSADNYAVYSKGKYIFKQWGIINNVNGILASKTEKYIDAPEGDLPIVYDPSSFSNLIDNVYKEKLTFNEKIFEDAVYLNNSSPLIKNGSIEQDWGINGQTLTLTNNLKLANFYANNGGATFNIDVQKTDTILYVNNLKLNGTINIKGKGKLKIFVKDSITFGNTFLNTNGDSNNLDIYYAGNKQLSFDNNVHVKANFFIKQANMDYSGGGGLNGEFYSNGTGTVKLSGGIFNDTVKFVVPNYYFTVTGGASIKGSIICNTFEMSGGANIDFRGNNTSSPSNTAPIESEPVIEKNV